VFEGSKGLVDAEGWLLMEANDKAANKQRLLNDEDFQLTKANEWRRLPTDEGCWMTKPTE
jgi:hypothetical protein